KSLFYFFLEKDVCLQQVTYGWRGMIEAPVYFRAQVRRVLSWHEAVEGVTQNRDFRTVLFIPEVSCKRWRVFGPFFYGFRRCLLQKVQQRCIGRIQLFKDFAFFLQRLIYMLKNHVFKPIYLNIT